jgi:hypothetical protein
MFRWVRTINNRNPSSLEAHRDGGGQEPVEGDLHLQRSCQQFHDSLQAYSEMLSLRASELTVDCPNLRKAHGEANRALQELRSRRASSAIDTRAKMEAWFALEKFLGNEDPRVTSFACELIGEVYPFIASSALSKETVGNPERKREIRFRLAKFICFWLGS